jgi:menaquinone-dependent protoporphyrinogen oxidase
MRVLVSAASRHGATEGIAREIAAGLAEAGHEPVIVAPDAVTSLDGFDAAVLGSAIYMGEWMDAARALVERFAGDLATRPVWLFSSGPLGEAAGTAEVSDASVDGEGIAALVTATHAREHRMFAGRYDPREVGLGEKTLLSAVRAPEGDFRPWPDIREWAASIAAALRAD